ncbi:hypothetical protein GGH12_004749 [Coemansia sp. RSA 1822]|nr:hypothetical protein GGF49_005175 [Coemansia sp. RSA 1853]KAJ2560538.1 hypothetical protein GGH12_004749 [Coemansia sp. RSA 1822]
MVNTPPSGTYQQQVPASTQQYAPPQPTSYYGQHQHVPNAQHLPYGVPPRCATGPAVESPYQNYAYTANNSYPAMYGDDPYRSASVVYGGTYNGFQHANQTAPVHGVSATRPPDDTAFFDQFVGNSVADATVPQSTTVPEQSQSYGGYTNGSLYDAQYGTAASFAGPGYSTANIGSAAAESENVQAADTSNGVVFDEASGQYYDVNSGQYYDEASGTWYYADQSQPAEAAVCALAPEPKVAKAVHNISSPEPVNGVDDASFFDNLNDAVSGPAFVEQHQLTSSGSEHLPALPATLQGDLSAIAEVCSSPTTDNPFLAESSQYPVQTDAPDTASVLSDAGKGASAACQIAQDTSSQHSLLASSAGIDESESLYPEVPVSNAEEALFSAPVPGGIDVTGAPADVVSPTTASGPTVTAEPAFSEEAIADQPRNVPVTQETPMSANGSIVASPTYGDHSHTPIYDPNNLPVARHDISATESTHADSIVAESVQVYAPFDDTEGTVMTMVSDTPQYYSHDHHVPPTMATDIAAGESATATTTSFTDAQHYYSQSYDTPPISTVETVALADASQYYNQGYDAPLTSAAGAAVATLGYESLDARTAPAGQDGAAAYTTDYDAYSNGPIVQDSYAAGYPPNYSQEQTFSEYGAYAGTYANNASYQPVDASGLVEDAARAYTQGFSDSTYAANANVYTGGYGEVEGNGVAMYSAESSEPSGMVQDLNGMANGAIVSGTLQQTSSFEFVDSSGNASTEVAHYERQASMPVSGTEPYVDPLGRLSARRPIASFGFGGQLVTMIPRQVQRFSDYGSGGALKIAPGMLSMQPLSSIIPHKHNAESLPAAGLMPLLTGDTSRATLAKRRDAAISCAKTLLSDSAFAEELSAEEQALYRVLIAVLQVADQPDFQKLSLDEAAAAIHPLFAKRPEDADEPNDSTMGARECLAPIAHGTTAELKNIEVLLLAGQRSEAIAFAREHGMWVHALIIASCTGKDDWQAVVAAYVESAVDRDLAPLGAQYRLFAGLGDRAFAETPAHFVTATELGGAEQTVSADGHAVDDWARTLVLALANRTPGDHMAMIALGDRLKERGQVLPAHICYALTLQGKDIFHGVDTAPRAVLLGADERARSSDGAPFEMTYTRFSHFYRKPVAIFLTELYELAFVLRAAPGDTTVAGTPGAPKKLAPLLCLPHLQAYKLAHAWWLVDCGQMALASQYCDALLGILAALPAGTAVPFIHASLVQELRSLRERLSGSGMSSVRAAEMAGNDAALVGVSPKSWLARAVPRPSFTSLMTAFDSSIDKFITGADGSRISLESNSSPGKFEVGPSRHTPQPQAVDLQAYSATSHVSPRQSMDSRPSATPTPGGHAEPPRMYTPSSFGPASHPTPPPAPQWGDPGSMAVSAAQGDFIVPGMAFGDPAMNSLSLGPGFSAPGGAPAPDYASAQGYAPSLSVPPPQPVPDVSLNDEEDMFGFSRKKTPAPPSSSSVRPSFDTSHSKPASARQSTDARDPKVKADSQPDGKEGSGVMGILKSFWGGRKNQANLGEESNFVFDPVQQRWVDKNAPNDHQDAGPPPPPPPSMMRFQPQNSTPQPPASFNNATNPMPPMLQGTGAAAFGAMNGFRSSSAAPPVPSADPSRTGTPMSTPDISALGGMPPVSAGSRAGAAKRRGARSRYVDVLNQ